MRSLRSDRFIVSALLSGAALLHLSAHLVVGRLLSPTSLWWSAGWPSLAAMVALAIVARDFMPSRRRHFYPERAGIAAWAGSAAITAVSSFPGLVPAGIVPGLVILLLARFIGRRESVLMSMAVVLYRLFSASPEARSAVFLGDIIIFVISQFVVTPFVEPLPVPEWEPPPRPKSRLDTDLEEKERVREIYSGDGLRRAIVDSLERIFFVAGAGSFHFVAAEPSLNQVVPPPVGPLDDPRGIPILTLDYPPLHRCLVDKSIVRLAGEEAGAFPVRSGDEVLSPTAILAVPVINEGKSQGIVAAIRLEGQSFAPALLPLMEFAAASLAREIAWWRVLEREVRELQGEKVVHGVVKQIASFDQSDDGAARKATLMQAVAKGLRETIDANRVFIVEVEGEQLGARIAGASPIGEGSPDSSSTGKGPSDSSPVEAVPIGGTFLETVFRAEKSFPHRIVSGVRLGSGRVEVLPFVFSKPGEENFLIYALPPQSGDFRGAIVCTGGSERGFDAQDKETVAVFADVLTLGLSHVLREENLRQASETDGLTGLLNHKTFCNNLKSALSRLDGRHQAAVVMIDIDHFKRVNDTYGHPAGDAVIRTVSALLQKTIRRGDFAGRYGGEEFALYLNMSDRTQAEKVAERIRTIVRRSPVVFDGKTIQVTVSLGVSCHPEKGYSGPDLLKAADQALYRSKKEGRDRVTFA